MKLTKTILGFILLSLAIAVSACSSSSDEPEKDSGKGKEIAQWIEKNVLTNPTDIRLYTDGNNDAVYYGAIADDQAARRFIGKMLDSQWDGKPTTFNVPDNYGTIKITDSDKDGIFYSVTVNVRGVKPFTLQLATKSYCESSNMRVLGS